MSIEQPRVIMATPNIDEQGGIASVVKEYLNAGLANRVNLRLIETHRQGALIFRIYYFLRSLTKYFLEIIRAREAIVHLHLAQKGSFIRKFILFLFAKICLKKTVVHLHGSQFEKFMHSNNLTRFLTRFMFEHADRVLVLSSRWNKKVTNFAPRSCVVTLYNPTPLSFVKKSCDKSVNALFLGRLGERKGTYDLISCIKKNSEVLRNRKTRFTLAGDGDVEKIKKIVDAAGISDLVDFPGWISGNQKKSYLQNSDFVVLPSYNEQMPMSILEGMACGRPILGTNIGGVPEMIEDGKNGYLMEPGDVDRLGECILKLSSDSELRQQMGRRSREIVSHKFESSLIINQLLRIYEDVLRG